MMFDILILNCAFCIINQMFNFNHMNFKKIYSFTICLGCEKLGLQYSSDAFGETDLNNMF